ncbi:hypothetical protein RCL1_001157 [Eukaryota sp. TZLM3-RCL]
MQTTDASPLPTLPSLFNHTSSSGFSYSHEYLVSNLCSRSEFPHATTFQHNHPTFVDDNGNPSHVSLRNPNPSAFQAILDHEQREKDKNILLRHSLLAIRR